LEFVYVVPSDPGQLTGVAEGIELDAAVVTCAAMLLAVDDIDEDPEDDELEDIELDELEEIELLRLEEAKDERELEELEELAELEEGEVTEPGAGVIVDMNTVDELLVVTAGAATILMAPTLPVL
jgi:hypothetical protein